MTSLNSASANAAAIVIEDGLLGDPVPLWKQTLKRLIRKRSGQVGLFLIGFMVLVAIFAPVIAPYDPNQVLIGIEQVKRRDPPCIHMFGCDVAKPQHIMGIDGNSRDIFSRIVYGTRVRLRVVRGEDGQLWGELLELCQP